MIWGVYDFDAMIVTYEASSSSELPYVDRTRQCVVQRATTAEDRMYLGDKWQCMHCLEPESCTSCNPKYKDATLLECVPCESITWHLDSNCLHCEEMREEINHESG